MAIILPKSSPLPRSSDFFRHWRVRLGEGGVDSAVQRKQGRRRVTKDEEDKMRGRDSTYLRLELDA